MTSPVGILQRLRLLCLSFPETSERSSWGHPNFRAGRKWSRHLTASLAAQRAYNSPLR